MHIILASASPRRQELLGRMGYAFEIKTADVQEQLPPEIGVGEAAQYLAALKCTAVAKLHSESIVIGVDTIVVAGGEILGKPQDTSDAQRMLRQLSGSWHEVHSGVCVRVRDDEYIFTEVTKVHFTELSDDDIADYIKTGESLDKAGAYGIQGYAGKFIDRIEGCYYNVMGLPMAHLDKVLKGILQQNS